MGFRHIYFKEDVCTGCNLCVDVCMCDALVPHPVKGKPPIERYPEECWFCGCCMTFCPQLEKGAIQIVTPFPMRGGFRSPSPRGGEGAAVQSRTLEPDGGDEGGRENQS